MLIRKRKWGEVQTVNLEITSQGNRQTDKGIQYRMHRQ